MKRRDLLKGGAVLGAGLLAGCDGASTNEQSGSNGSAEAGSGAPAVVRNKRTFRLATTWPKNFPGLGTAPEKVAQRVSEATDGDVTIKVYSAGELAPAFGAFDAASTGAVDMYHGAEYYWQGKSKAFNFFTSVPFGLNKPEMDAWIHFGGGQELWDELSAKFNIKPFACANTGNQMGGWFKKEINTLEDLKGLKIRIPGLGGEVLRRLGAAAVALPGGEIFQSLQAGTIDATEWVGPWNDRAFGFYEVAKNYYWPGFHEPGAQLCLGVNLDIWNSMTKAQQAILRDACSAETEATYAEFNARNAEALRALVNDHGVQLRRFSDEILTAVGGTAGEVLKEVAAEDELTQRVYKSFLEARKTGMEWGRISEEAYAAARRLPFDFE